MGRHEWLDDVAPARGEPRSAPEDDALAPWDRPYHQQGDAGPALDRPGSLRRWGLRGCLILVLAAAAVVGFRLAAGQAQVASLAVPSVDTTVRAPASSARPSTPDGGAPAPSGTGAAAQPAPNAGTGASRPSVATDGPGLTVHVVGAVKRPGLYRLGPGARVDEAVRAAGGAQRGAALTLLNLAAPLIDGTQLRVPAAGEEPLGPYAAQTGAPPGGAAASGPSGGGVGASGGGVRVNSASQSELETLPGVGPALAQRIIAFRSSNGPLRGEEDLDAIPGIGPAMLEKLRGAVSYE